MATEIVTTAASMEIKAVAARKDEYIITIFLYFPKSSLSILPESVFATAITTAATIHTSTHHHLS